MAADLNGRHAVVCGSTSGIGKASALALASAGASVTLISRNEASLKNVLNELPSVKGQQHGYLVADFSEPEKLKTIVTAFAAGRSVHILVNNTGGPPGGPILEAKEKEFYDAFSAHLVCNHILVQAFVSGMKKAGYGRIVNIISTSVKQPLKGLGVSNTIRAAVASWSKTLSMELAPFGITVNNVLPGMTDTPRIQQLLKARSEKTGKSVEQLKEEMIAEIPMGRIGDPSETAAAVLFLASPAASYITGIHLPVDGGRTGSL